MVVQPLAPNERATLATLLAVVLPSTSGPGAREAGAVQYVLARLAAPEADALPELRAMLREASGDEAVFLERLSVADDRLFRRLRSWAWEGYLCDPHRGGNRDGVGWNRLSAPLREKAPRS